MVLNKLGEITTDKPLRELKQLILLHYNLKKMYIRSRVERYPQYNSSP